jgi:hypothetical protein
VDTLFVRTLANGLGQFTQFLGQPRNGRRNSSCTIAVSERLFDDLLEIGDFHEVTVGDVQPSVDLTQASRNSRPFSPEVRPFTVPSAPTITMNG